MFAAGLAEAPLVVTVPVVLIGYFQWGFTGDFALLVGLYLVIQTLDGNVLVPLLFSEVVNLHPVAIIVAVLVFGGIWGFWGVFFAIPLGTLVNAVIRAWPDLKELEEGDDSGEPAVAADGTVALGAPTGEGDDK